MSYIPQSPTPLDYVRAFLLRLAATSLTKPWASAAPADRGIKHGQRLVSPAAVWAYYDLVEAADRIAP